MENMIVVNVTDDTVLLARENQALVRRYDFSLN